jgi:hypothetical protein
VVLARNDDQFTLQDHDEAAERDAKAGVAAKVGGAAGGRARRKQTE